jgi:hypothetical protein
MYGIWSNYDNSKHNINKDVKEFFYKLNETQILNYH